MSGCRARLGSVRRARLRFEPAGCDLRTRFLPFENRNLITQLLHRLFQLLDALLLEVNNRQQTLDKPRPLRGRNRGKPDQLRLFPQVIEKLPKE